MAAGTTAAAGDRGGGGGNASPASINRAQRMAVLHNAIEMTQQIFSQQLQAGQLQVNIAPRNVGLVKKFIINIQGIANNTGGANALLSDFGLSNILSQVIFTDLNNNVRVQTAGWHLALLQALKNQWPMTSALLLSALQEFSGDMGAAWNVIVAPNNFATGTSQPFSMWFEVPLAYSDDDLRGAVYMNVVNAVAQLTLNINANPFVAAATDSTLACWKGSAGNVSAVTVTVYQVYLDQLPVAKNGQPILPALDLSTVYELKNTTFGPFTAAQDNPMPYANFRDFLSTFMIYNSNPAADAGRTVGADVNYLALQSANFTNIWKISPLLAALKTRLMLAMDLSRGTYYFSSRRKPISTTTFGNMQLINNPVTAAAGNYTLIGYEDFANVNTLLSGAGSLAGS